jgi:CPA1 family monovalent cation:H+ antiporter
VNRTRPEGRPFFGGLPARERDGIADVATEREFAAGESLTSEGDFGHCLFVIESGSAAVSTNEPVTRAINPGSVVGEIAVLASGRRTASVVAATPVRAVAFFKRDVWNLEQTAPELERRFREALGEHVGSTSN